MTKPGQRTDKDPRAPAARFQAFRARVLRPIIPIGKETDATMEARIQFASGSSQLGGAARTLLDDGIALFRADPAMVIVVQGYNMELGVQRAQAVRDYIVSRGISANRVIVDSRGEGIAPEANRRVIRLLIVP